MRFSTTISDAEASARSRRQAFWLYAAISALILFRTLPFVLYGREAMDGDEGLFALMSRQLSLGRAFPIFGYGSVYNFAFAAWLGAPFVSAFGATAAAVKAPLLMLNLAVGNGTAFLLRRLARLSAWETFLCCLWFALPSLETSRGLMDNSIGGIEPFFFIGLIWLLRRRPWLAGFVAGIGAVQRPFVLYAIPALWLLEWRPSKKITRPELASIVRWIGAWIGAWIGPWIGPWIVSAAAGMALIEALARFSSNYFGSASPLGTKRVLFMLEDVRGYFAEIIPKTIGLQVQRFKPPVLVARDELARSSHFNALGLCLSALGVVLLGVALRFVWRAWRSDLPGMIRREELRFPLYLLLVGLISFGVYVVAAPPSPDIRFTFLLLLGFVGAYALYAKLGSSAAKEIWVRRLVVVFALGCAANNCASVLGGWRQLSQLEAAHPQRNLIQYLENHGITAAIVDFASAYNLAFSSGEKITVTDDLSGGRIPANTRVYLTTPPRNRARITLTPCGPTAAHVENWYVCIPGPAS